MFEDNISNLSSIAMQAQFPAFLKRLRLQCFAFEAAERYLEHSTVIIIINIITILKMTCS